MQGEDETLVEPTDNKAVNKLWLKESSKESAIEYEGGTRAEVTLGQSFAPPADEAPDSGGDLLDQLTGVRNEMTFVFERPREGSDFSADELRDTAEALRDAVLRRGLLLERPSGE